MEGREWEKAQRCNNTWSGKIKENIVIQGAVREDEPGNRTVKCLECHAGLLAFILGVKSVSKQR